MPKLKLLLAFLLLGATTPLAAHQKAGPAGDQPIPEVAFQIRASSYFFKIKNPKDFNVARPESFQDMSQFKTADLYYTVNERLETVWTKYMAINPLKIWSNARSQITAAYVPSQDRTLYRKDLAGLWSGFEEGMKVFVDMSSLPVAVTNKPAIMVGLKIARIDPAERSVEFRYLEGTPSYGKQVITFRSSASNPNITEISHQTWFRSYGALIEKLYPLYHRKMINGMHARFKWEIEGDRAP